MSLTKLRCVVMHWSAGLRQLLTFYLITLIMQIYSPDTKQTTRTTSHLHKRKKINNWPIPHSVTILLKQTQFWLSVLKGQWQMVKSIKCQLIMKLQCLSTLSLAYGKTSLMTFEKYGRMSDKTAMFQNLVSWFDVYSLHR